MRLLILVLLPLLLSSATLAQNGTWQMPVFDAVNPEFTARDLKVMTRVLQLSPEGERALTDLYTGYAAQLRAESDKVKSECYDLLDRAELMNNDALLEPVRDKARQYKTRADQLQQQFLADLKSLLTREQEANWPTMERELRRIKSIHRGLLCGESIDVVAMTEDALAGADMPSGVADALLRYRADIDHALAARDAYLKGDGRDFQQAVQSDPARARRQWQDSLRLRMAVRDVNERASRQVAEQLPEAQRAAFERAVFEASYPMLHRPARLDSYIEDALKVESLTAEQKSRLLEVQSARAARVRAWARQAALGWRQFQEQAMPEPLARALGQPTQQERAIMFNGSWLPDDHPLIRSRHERVEIDRDFRQRIDAILTPEQRDGIPARLNEYAKFEVWTNHGI